MRTPLRTRLSHPILSLPLLGIALLLLATCGDYLAEPYDGPREVRGIHVSEPELEIADGDLVHVDAVVVDQRGNAFEALPPGASVQWASSDSGVVAIDGEGLAVSLVGAWPGSADVTATVEGAGGQAGVTVAVTVAPVPTTLRLVGGDAQEGAVGDTLPAPLAVRLEDRHEMPVPDIWVRFEVAEGSGSVEPDSVRTDTAGIATARWTLGTRPGTQRVSAVAAGLDTIHFAVEAVVGPVVGVQVSPQVDTLLVGDTARFHAAAVDRFGNAAAEAGFAWSVGDAAFASVDSAGLVTARAAGVTHVVASAGAGADTATVVVLDDGDDTPPGRPDLEVSAVELAQEAAVRGGQLTVQAEVRNAGTERAPESTVAFEVLDAEDVGRVLARQTFLAGPLAVEASQTVGVPLRVGFDWPAAVVVRVHADGDDAIEEIDESNNTAMSGTVPVAPHVGDPYEPNDSPETVWDIDDLRDAVLDAADAMPGLPFRTVNNDLYGTPTVDPEDVDAFRFSLPSDALLLLEASAGTGTRVAAVVMDSATGDVVMHPGLEFFTGSTRAALNLEGGRTYYVGITGSSDMAGETPYTLALSSGEIHAHDYLNGTPSLEPNDLSGFAGANRTAEAALPFDVLGSLDNGDGMPDIDLIRVPGEPGETVEVLVRNNEPFDSDAVLSVALLERSDPGSDEPLRQVADVYVRPQGGVDTLRATLGEAPLYIGIYSLASGATPYDVCVRSPGEFCRADFLLTTGGTEQDAEPGEWLAEPLEVTVYDRFERPVAGVPVGFAAATGLVEHPVVLTDENGVASTRYRMPHDAAFPSVRASVLGAPPVIFQLGSAMPDLMPSDFGLESGDGDAFTLTAYVRVVNIGMAESAPSDVAVRLLDATTQDVLAETVAPLDPIPGDWAEEVIADFTPTADWPLSLIVEAEVDPGNDLVESDETNNTGRSEPYSFGPADPYEPNDTPERAWDIDDLRDPALDAMDAEAGLPFMASMDPALGIPALQPGDTDLFRFSPDEDTRIDIVASGMEDYSAVLAVLSDSASGEVPTTIYLGGDFGRTATMNLEGGRTYFLRAEPSNALTRTVQYRLAAYPVEGWGDDPMGHDYINGIRDRSAEPNDLSVFEGAQRSAAIGLPFDVDGRVSNAGFPDVDLYAVKAEPGTEVEVLAKNVSGGFSSAPLAVSLVTRGEDGQLTGVDPEPMEPGEERTLRATVGAEPLFVRVSTTRNSQVDYALCVRVAGTGCRAAYLLKDAATDEQVGERGELLPDSLRVRVLDEREAPVPGVDVSFTADDGSGYRYTAVTDEDGWAATTYRLPNQHGTYPITASVLGTEDVTFTASTARPDLTVQEVRSLADVLYRGTGFTVRAVVANIGEARAGITSTLFRVLDPKTDRVLDETSVVQYSIEPGAERTIWAELTPGETWPGNVVIEVVTDPGGDVWDEADTSNNTGRTEPIPVVAAME